MLTGDTITQLGWTLRANVTQINGGMTSRIKGAELSVRLFQKQRYVRAGVYTATDKQPKE